MVSFYSFPSFHYPCSLLRITNILFVIWLQDQGIEDMNIGVLHATSTFCFVTATILYFVYFVQRRRRLGQANGGRFPYFHKKDVYYTSRVTRWHPCYKDLLRRRLKQPWSYTSVVSSSSLPSLLRCIRFGWCRISLCSHGHNLDSPFVFGGCSFGSPTKIVCGCMLSDRLLQGYYFYFLE